MANPAKTLVPETKQNNRDHYDAVGLTSTTSTADLAVLLPALVRVIMKASLNTLLWKLL